MVVGFIGLGNMAKAMISGMIAKKVVAPENIIASRRSEAERNVSAAKFGIRVTEDNIEVVKQADLIVLAIKPQYYSQILEKIKPFVEGKCIVSIAPGKSIAYLHEMLGDSCKIIRTMPNTPALVGEGCTAVTFDEFVPLDKKEEILEIFESFGKAYEIVESLMDVVVGVSGSSPAYVFMLIEAMADGAVLHGMPRELAYQFAAQAVLGSAKMVLETGKHPGELKDMVCSPGGTTIQAVKVLENKKFRGAIIDAENACIEKAKSL
jgi:pyrroline-5-carboxylate reductase